MCCSSLKAQSNKDIIINISAHPVLNRNEFLIDINRHNDVVSIVYTLLDSISYNNLKQNPRFVELLNTTKTNAPNRSDVQAELNTLIKKQSYYSRDSILINSDTDTAYTDLLNKVSSLSTDSLENTIANKHRYILDGIHFRFDIKTAAGNREAYAHSPDATSHPVLYGLIESSLGIYRKLKGDAFLTKYRTSYY